MKTRNDFQEYTTVLKFYYEGDMSIYKKHIANKVSDRNQSKLLEGRYLLKTRKWEEAQELLSGLKLSDQFLEGERNIILGSTYEYQGNFQAAALRNSKALMHYRECEDQHGMFLSRYNLSVSFHRLALDDLSMFHLLQCEKIAINNDQKCYVSRGMAFAHLRQNNLQDCRKYLDMFMELIQYQNEEAQNISYTVASDIYFRLDDHQKAFEILSKLKSVFSHREKSRVFFEYHVLKAFIEGTKLGSMPESLSESNEYNLKWSILIALQTGQKEDAEQMWDKLVKSLPQRYLRGMKCANMSDDKNVFMTYLRKLANKKHSLTINEINVRGKKAKMLLEKLYHSNGPIRKEALIEEIWGVSYAPEFDARFYKLIERLRGAIPAQIVNQNNAYFIAS
jgi:hypothetical protein